MESQQKGPEFSLSKDGKAKVEYNKFRFVFKDKYTKINVSKKEMKLLISLLPEFQRKAKELFHFDNDKLAKNKDWKIKVISKYKQYKTRITLNTYDELAYVWRLFLFDDYKNNKADKKVSKEIKRKTCFRGVIIVVVNVADLNRFVQNCLQS